MNIRWYENCNKQKHINDDGDNNEEVKRAQVMPMQSNKNNKNLRMSVGW